MRPILAVLCCVVVSQARLAAVEVAGVRLPTTADVAGQELALRGADLLRWKWVVKIYVAALYLPSHITTTRVLEDIPRRIDFHYRRGFTAAQLVEATNATITRGMSPEAAKTIQPALTAFNALYQAVKEGDVMTIDYVPGSGTGMRLNGILLGTVPGAEFARALFAIWIGDQAVDEDLKSALLGGE